MTTPARPRAAGSTRSSWQDPEPPQAPEPANIDRNDDFGIEAPAIDLRDAQGDSAPTDGHPRRTAALRPLQVDGEDADDHPMAETESTPPRREAGVSFPMTTTAQVELRNAIRARTQQRLEDLRARTSA